MVGSKLEPSEGSAKLALKTKNEFDRYVFIEQNRDFAKG